MASDANSWMTYRDRPVLDGAVQCRGRMLNELEQSFADALEATFAQGIHDMKEVAENLSTLGVKAPESGDATWSVEILSHELQQLNSSLDAAYEEDGYGA